VDYRINSRGVSLREFRIDASFPAALFSWLVTRLPVRVPGSSEYPACESLKAHVVSPTRVPAAILEDFEAPTAELVRLGFRGRVFHVIDDTANQTSHYLADFVSRSGDTIARVRRRTFRATTPHRQYHSIEFISQAADGTFLVTSSTSSDLLLPDSIRHEAIPKVAIAEQWQRHQQRLQELRATSAIRTVADARGVIDTLEELHQRIHQRFVERKIFVPIDPSAAQIPVRSGAPAAAALPVDQPPLDSDASQLLHEVRRRENKQASNPKTAALLLIVTGALFFALGGFAWSWTFTLFLIPILLFHELGHFLCMKMFDYRNVRMFFIPLFGAAVSGQNYNVPGWKRIVTSLMGPLPGIALGIALGIVGLVRGYDLLVQGALIMIVLNGFNLIPALPLDGGWVVHGLLFSRHAFLDLIFRVAAIGLLLLVGIAGGGFVTLGLGVAMIVGLPASFHTARITDRLRGKNKSLLATDATQISSDAVSQIAKELDLAYPKGIALKNKAALVLQIYQNVNSPPPGILGTLTLGSVYLASLVTAVIGGAVIALGQHSDLGRLIAEGAFGPKFTVSPAEIVRRPTGVTTQQLASQDAIIANFPDRATAEQALATFESQLALERRLILFGQTLMLPMETSDARKQRDAWFNQLEPLTADSALEEESNTFVDHAEQRAMIQLACIARSAEEAKQLETLANGYLQTIGVVRLIAPWDPQAKLTEDQFKARRTVAELTSVEWMGAEDRAAANVEINRQLESAQRRGRQAEVKRILGEMYQRQRTEHDAHVEQLRQAGSEYDPEIIDAYQKAYAAETEKTPADRPVFLHGNMWLDKLAGKLGQYEESSQAPQAFSTRHGFVSRNGLMLNIHISFESTTSGLLAMVDWLNGHGCVDFRYGIASGSAYEE
jgi:Zn-dependent protease